MRKRFKDLQSRRELFAGVCRYGALGLLVVGAGGIFAKRRRLLGQGRCISSRACAGCEILAQCDLPRALSTKETLIGGDNVGE
ncbi:MAG: hypothetical protein AMJ65_14910 [Phycisphaerae bacterium SG8_4]|nr:MAG: hypothetical protein AMJ65_14910 [Phycisphaerae bacterium SG8_4]